jgi:hypothetical protein
MPDQTRGRTNTDEKKGCARRKQKAEKTEKELQRYFSAILFPTIAAAIRP